MISAAARTSAYGAPTSAPANGSTFGEPSIDLNEQTATPHADADEYSAWAERLRQKRVDAKQVISGSPVDDRPTTNWSTQGVFAESQRIADNDTRAHRDPVGVSAAYGVLGLEIGAGLDEVDARYRKLAKEHHPDRFIGEGPEIQRSHADMFRAINTAREVVRQSFGAF